MGYRSNVALAFYTRDRDKGRAAFVKAWLTQNGVLDNKYAEVVFIEDRGVLIRFNDVKWYDSYKEVADTMTAFQRFAAELCDESFDVTNPILYGCEYMRIGEEDEDIETKRSDHNEYVLQLQRDIGVDL